MALIFRFAPCAIRPTLRGMESKPIEIQLINTSTHQHINTSTHQHIITSAHHHIITSAHHHISKSSHHHISKSCGVSRLWRFCLCLSFVLP
jgi:hypothetical protein